MLKQIILLMIPNEEKGWHYRAGRKSALLRGMTSKDDNEFYFLNCLHFFRAGNKLKSHEKVCKIKLVIPSEKDNTLEFNQYVKLDKMPYIIYADIEALIKK